MTLDCTCNRLKESEEKAAKWDALVRCRDCVNGIPTTSGKSVICSEWSNPEEGFTVYVPLDGFCYRGETEEDE